MNKSTIGHRHFVPIHKRIKRSSGRYGSDRSKHEHYPWYMRRDPTSKVGREMSDTSWQDRVFNGLEEGIDVRTLLSPVDCANRLELMALMRASEQLTWFDQDKGEWLADFLKTYRKLMSAYDGGRQGQMAAQGIAWHLGMILCNPQSYAQEQVDYILEMRENFPFLAHKYANVDLKQLLEESLADMQQLNNFVRRLLVASGLLEKVWQALLLIQGSSSPLFVDWAWKPWQVWAHNFLFSSGHGPEHGHNRKLPANERVA